MLTPVYVYDKDLPQSRIPSTPSLLPIRDLPTASITINYSFVAFNYSFVTLAHTYTKARKPEPPNGHCTTERPAFCCS
jgi:hypothetical protein